MEVNKLFEILKNKNRSIGSIIDCVKQIDGLDNCDIREVIRMEQSNNISTEEGFIWLVNEGFELLEAVDYIVQGYLEANDMEADSTLRDEIGDSMYTASYEMNLENTVLFVLDSKVSDNDRFLYDLVKVKWLAKVVDKFISKYGDSRLDEICFDAGVIYDMYNKDLNTDMDKLADKIYNKFLI